MSNCECRSAILKLLSQKQTEMSQLEMRLQIARSELAHLHEVRKMIPKIKAEITKRERRRRLNSLPPLEYDEQGRPILPDGFGGVTQ